MTARNFLKQYLKNNENGKYDDCMIEFAKYHVEQALRAASESKSTYIKIDLDGTKTHPTALNKQSILKAYPLTNVK